MIDPLLPQDEGSTPLTEEEREGLIPSYIVDRHELNEAEQSNILAAEEWAFRRPRNVLSQKFLNELHKRLFGEVWSWAGEYRKTGKTIGVEAYQIPTCLQQLIDDCTYWLEHSTYEPDETAARFHHRLVFIHPYVNGNGRHSRLAADLLLASLEVPRFTWGKENLVSPGDTRTRYIEALQAADEHDYAPLLGFVRS